MRISKIRGKEKRGSRGNDGKNEVGSMRNEWRRTMGMSDEECGNSRYEWK